MSNPSIWWLLAGATVAMELLTGTFYLLMIAIGLSAGALSAHAGAPTVWQLLASGLVGVIAVAAWHQYRRKSAPAVPATANKDVNLDIGETVNVAQWQADGTASVHYRGAQWLAVPASPAPPHGAHTGNHRIVEVIGNRLVVEPIQRP